MKKAFIITVSILSSIILVLTIMLFSTKTSLTTTSASLENLYQRSFYDLVDNVNNMESDVSKLMVTNDSASQQKLLSSIKQKSSDAENDLSLLPISSNLLEKTSTFINKMNGYCTSLITYKDGTLEKNDFERMQKVYNSISNIKSELNNLMNKIMSGYRISDNIGNSENIGDFSNSLSNMSSDTVEYPSLIYDGPFSDTSLNKTIKGLNEKVITENDAENLITKLFENKITNLNYIGETQGNFNTYDFGVSTENGRNYYIQVTKQGGFLLTMNSNILESNNILENNNVVENTNNIENDIQLSSNSADDNNNENKQISTTEKENNTPSNLVKLDEIDSSENSVKNAPKNFSPPKSKAKPASVMA